MLIKKLVLKKQLVKPAQAKNRFMSFLISAKVLAGMILPLRIAGNETV